MAALFPGYDASVLMQFGRKTLVAGSLVLVVIIAALGWGLVTATNKSPEVVLNHQPPPLAIRTYGDDRTLDLARLRGLPVVLNFWASWCLYCREEAPLLNAQARRSRGRVAFLGADIEDSPAAAERFLAQYQVLYPTGPIVKGNRYAWRVTAPPETFFINRQGVPIFSVGGPVSPGQMEIGIRELSQ